jgi:hypothetical protein
MGKLTRLLQVWATPEIEETLRDEAWKRHVNMSVLMREALQLYIDMLKDNTQEEYTDGKDD